MTLDKLELYDMLLIQPMIYVKIQTVICYSAKLTSVSVI